MRTDTVARQIERPCSFDPFLTVLGKPTPALAGVPRTLRNHVGQREFGDFGTVLMAERPASADLSDRVARWRTTGTRNDLPLRAYPDHTAEDRRFNILFVLTPITLMLWILVGLMAAWLKGAL